QHDEGAGDARDRAMANAHAAALGGECVRRFAEIERHRAPGLSLQEPAMDSQERVSDVTVAGSRAASEKPRFARMGGANATCSRAMTIESPTRWPLPIASPTPSSTRLRRRSRPIG